MTSSLPPAPPPPPEPQSFDGPGWRAAAAAAPPALRPVVGLLLANLALSVLLTVIIAVDRNRIIDYQLDARHVTDPDLRASLRHSYTVTIVSRALSNVLVSVVYVFLVRALLRGRRWAYRRVIWVGVAGSIALLALQLTPYPWWMHAEQLVQVVVLAALVWCVTRPQVRAHFAPGLPGRDVGRFNRRR